MVHRLFALAAACLAVLLYPSSFPIRTAAAAFHSAAAAGTQEAAAPPTTTATTAAPAELAVFPESVPLQTGEEKAGALIQEATFADANLKAAEANQRKARNAFLKTCLIVAAIHLILALGSYLTMKYVTPIGPATEGNDTYEFLGFKVMERLLLAVVVAAVVVPAALLVSFIMFVYRLFNFIYHVFKKNPKRQRQKEEKVGGRIEA
ncbi:hypothetical protein Efla_004290 [Eimeria flavescens]